MICCWENSFWLGTSPHFRFQFIIVSISRSAPLVIDSDNVDNIHVIGSRLTPNIPRRGTFTQLPSCYCPKPTQLCEFADCMVLWYCDVVWYCDIVQNLPNTVRLTWCKCSADCPEIGSCIVARVCKLYARCGIVVWYCGIVMAFGIEVLRYCDVDIIIVPSNPTQLTHSLLPHW